MGRHPTGVEILVIGGVAIGLGILIGYTYGSGGVKGCEARRSMRPNGRSLGCSSELLSEDVDE